LAKKHHSTVPSLRVRTPTEGGDEGELRSYWKKVASIRVTDSLSMRTVIQWSPWGSEEKNVHWVVLEKNSLIAKNAKGGKPGEKGKRIVPGALENYQVSA